MITYPNLERAVLGKLADATGEPVDVVKAWVTGGVAVPAHLRPKIAKALRLPVDDLFPPVPGLPADRFVTDPDTLRKIDRPRVP